MIANRELTMDDYMAMLRRRAKLIVIPAVAAPLLGFLVSYAFPPKYTSTSTILVEGQKVPETMVQPVVSEDLTSRIATLQQQVLSQSELQPVVEKIFPNKNAAEIAAILDDIRSNIDVEPVTSTFSQIGSTTTTSSKKKPAGQSPVPGFTISYTSSNPQQAQQICNELTSLVITDDLKQIDAASKGTTEVLNRGIEDAKRTLDDLDAKLAAFKKQYVGELPGDEENNLKILMGLNSQLEANTQTLNRAQQDKAYTESILAEQLAAWKSSQSATNPQTLEKELSDLQAQLLQLQARYTDDHPDVIKAKADIAEVKKKLAEINNTKPDTVDASNDKASATEPPEIRQLRLQIHQYSDLISAATRDQKRLEQQIASYQGKVTLSPTTEEDYKKLTRDYDNAQKSYQDLLAKKSTADMTVQMNNESEGERMFASNSANLPDSPSFPVRWMFAAGGLGVGLALGTALAMWLEFRDNSIRNEADAEAALDLPILVTVPWVGGSPEKSKSGKFWRRKKKPSLEKDAVTA